MFCTECGSNNLSTPARAEDAWQDALHRLPIVGFPIALAVALLCGILAMLLLLDVTQLLPFGLALIIMLGGCYWALTFLPPAVRRIGWTAVRRLWRAVREGNRQGQRRR